MKDLLNGKDIKIIKKSWEISEKKNFFRKKDGINIDDIQSLKQRYDVTMDNAIATYSVAHAKESDAGKYECLFFKLDKATGNKVLPSAAGATFQVVKGSELVAIKVPKNINVVEGEPLKIECLTKGTVQHLEWKYGK